MLSDRLLWSGKNYLFCGNYEVAVNMSVISFLLVTCEAHDLISRVYLNDVIARVPYYKRHPVGSY